MDNWTGTSLPVEVGCEGEGHRDGAEVRALFIVPVLVAIGVHNVQLGYHVIRSFRRDCGSHPKQLAGSRWCNCACGQAT
jgi:hypothetical protein